MSVSKFLLLSCLTLALVAATLVRAEQPVVDTNVAGANCCEPACSAPQCCEPVCGAPSCCEPQCCATECCGPDCCDEKYHSECCGEGCPVCNMRCRDCCGKVCMAKVEEVTEEKSCWKVGCEEICVPRVVCPWSEGGSGLTLFNFMKKRHHHTGCSDCCDSCCDSGCNSCCGDCGCCQAPRCGDVRCVRTLSSEDYECTKCQCNWDIKEGCFRYGPGCCGRGCCGNGGCGCGVGCSDECGDGCGCAPAGVAPPAPAPAKGEPPVPPAPTSAMRSSNGKYRVTVAQAFGIKQTNCEEPAVSEPKAEETATKPTKSSWKLWK